jgi:hypothetical protein
VRGHHRVLEASGFSRIDIVDISGVGTLRDAASLIDGELWVPGHHFLAVDLVPVGRKGSLRGAASVVVTVGDDSEFQGHLHKPRALLVLG